MNFDATLFKGTATYYSKYRNGYDHRLYEEIIQKAQLDARSFVLDIGTGTGTIAHTLAPCVRGVYALEPSREMLDEAKQIAEERSLRNIVFIEDIAENIDRHEELEKIDLVTFGASLHWIPDTNAMFAKVAGVLKPGGWLSIQYIKGAHIWTEDPEKGWRYEVTNIVKKYLGEERKAGESSFKAKVARKDTTFEEKLLARSDLYGLFCRIEVEHTTTWTPERVIGLLYSTSFARRDYFGPQIEDFEKDIQTLFEQKGVKEWEEVEKHVALMAQKREHA
jgi:ubiquinone/menaquinone biosynthesis C-methylase UbiE